MPVITATELSLPEGAVVVACSHCGLPVPRAWITPGERLQFCCAGCRTAHALLVEAGLDGYYRLRDRLGEPGRAVGADADGFSEFDSQAFGQLYCEATASGTQRAELRLEGVHCAACVWLIERLPRLEPAVVSARLNVAQSVVELEWRPPAAAEEPTPARPSAGLGSPLQKSPHSGEQARAPLSDIARTLSRMGYRPRPLRGQKAADLHRQQLRGLLTRLGIAGASAGNVMLIAFALYSGADHDASLSTSLVSVRAFFHWASLIVSIPAVLAGSVFFRGAITALRTRTPHMDLPIAIGILAGFAWGTYGVLTDQGELYFDSITALIFLLLVGRYLQARHQFRGAEAAELLLSVVPAEVERIASVASADAQSGRTSGSAADWATERVPVDDVRPGDLVAVASGRVVPVDGEVVAGQSSLDRALLSGESLPLQVSAGDRVEAGCVNLGSTLVVRVETAGGATRVARLMKEVERAQRGRSRTVQLADRIAGAFTISVLGLAALVFLGTVSLGVPEALGRTLALLVVSCPCALAMATPLALNSAVGQAVQSRILIFGPEALETLARPCLLILDKTGTLTEGKLSVAKRLGDGRQDAVVLAMEREAHHPVGAALRVFLESEGKLPVELNAPVIESLGAGLSLCWEGRTYLLGAERFVRERAELSAVQLEALRHRPDSWSPILFARDGEVLDIFFVADRVRPDARQSLEALRAAGHRLAILSGDQQRSVDAVAREIAQGDPQFFEFTQGDCTPEDKLRAVSERVRHGGRCVMVGDGINDAGALSAASVGIAVSGAAEASQLSANVFLAVAGVSRLLTLFEGARRLRRTVARGIGFSLCYNALGITLAALGYLGPLGAAVLMPLSSITVISHALRSRMFAPGEPTR